MCAKMQMRARSVEDEPRFVVGMDAHARKLAVSVWDWTDRLNPCLHREIKCVDVDAMNRWGLSPKGEPYQAIGVDIGVAARSARNNQKNIAGCDTRTSHPAIAELRKVQHDNFAPCDSLTSHLATSRYRTLPLSPIAPCDSKDPLPISKTAPSTPHHLQAPSPSLTIYPLNTVLASHSVSCARKVHSCVSGSAYIGLERAYWMY